MKNKIVKAMLALSLVASMTVSSAVPAFAAASTDPNASAEREATNGAISQAAATEGMVLLENNNGVLPISSEEGTKVALFGAGTYATIKGGTGSGDVYLKDGANIDVWQGFEEAGYDIVNTSFLEAQEADYETKYAEYQQNSGWGGYVHLESAYAEEDVDAAAEQTDTAIYVLARNSGEGSDRSLDKGDYYLTDEEAANLKMLGQKFDKVVVVLNVGGIIDTNFFTGKGGYGEDDELNRAKIEGLDSLVLMSQAGQNGGRAIVEILNGSVNPSGKLTDTWAINFEDYPSSETFSYLDDDTYEEFYTEDIYVGYRYFDTYGIEPAYPFGYGLTYTDFTINVDSVEATTDQITVNATVTNTGDTQGKEVVEVYFSAPEDTDLDNPYQELAGYTKTENLQPGESQQVTVTFDTTELSSYNEEEEAYIIEDGNYIIRVGNSSRNTVEAASINIDQDVVTEECANLFGLTKDSMKEGTYDSAITMSSEAYAIDDMMYGSDVGITPTADGLSAQTVSLALKSEDFPETMTHTYTEGHVTAYVSADSDYTAGENEDVEVVATSADASYTLIDVANGDITMEQLVADMSPIELIDIVQGESYEGLAASSKDSDIIGYSAEMIYGSCGGTTSNLYNSRYIPNIEMVDGGAGVRINPTYQVYDPVPVDTEYDPETTYYTCQFSAWGGSSYNEISFESAEEFRAELESGTRLYTTDGVTAYQYCTATPVATVIAQTWNTELIEEQGRAVADEMLTYGATLWLALAMNIHRNPLGGRNFEYYSEDPVLTGKSATAISIGVTTKEDGTPTGVSTMPKHFAVNSQENSRFGGNSMASERAIREIYLKAFEMVVKDAQPFSIMSCYNQINGIPGYNSYALLTEVLVNEWGFEGFACTDWLSWYGSANCTAAATSATTPGTNAEAYDSGSAYGVSGDEAYKTQLWQLEAGQSLEMPGQNEAKVITAWENGELRLGDLQKNAMRILNVTMRSHQFELLQEKLEAAGK